VTKRPALLTDDATPKRFQVMVAPSELAAASASFDGATDERAS
jgi:hypothetical protein